MSHYRVPIDDARAQFPEYTFLSALTPSAQNAAFHVRDSEGNDLCLKLIAPNYSRDRLDREILALQTIKHPNVVQLKEYVFSSKPGDQKHYLIEEFVDGEDLSGILQPGSGWPHDKVADFFVALCQGLSALRDHGMFTVISSPATFVFDPTARP